MTTAEAVRTRTYVQALNEALDLAMTRDSSVFLLGEDIGRMGGDFGVTRGLFDKFGAERVRDTPLSEAAIVGICVGASMVGMRPIRSMKQRRRNSASVQRSDGRIFIRCHKALRSDVCAGFSSTSLMSARNASI